MAAAAQVNIELDRLSRRNFDRLARYIQSYAGIKMPETKLTMLEGRLRRRVRDAGYATINEYCDYIFDQGGLEQEAVALIDLATTNKTDFFRESKHFDVLESDILPFLAKEGVTRIRIWSAACSTGAEPYTLAMVLQDFCNANRNIDYKIIATDLCTDVLATARRGVYPVEMIEPVPDHMARRYVMRPVQQDRGEVRIHPSLRAKVEFARHNLMDRKYDVGGAVHMVFCRNVLIYFDRQTQSQVLSRLVDCLTPGGFLFVGHSESASGFDLPIKQVANTIFRKV